MRRGQGGGAHRRTKFEKPHDGKKSSHHRGMSSREWGLGHHSGMGHMDYGDFESFAEKEVHIGFYNRFRDDFDLEDLR